MAVFDKRAFEKRLEEVKESDPKWIQFEEEYQRHWLEWFKLFDEVDHLKRQKRVAIDDDNRRDAEQKLELKTLERDLAHSKRNKADNQRRQRSHELRRDLLLQELNRATDGELKREIQRRVEKVERWIWYRKGRVNVHESGANRCEERLGQLKKEESHRILDQSLKLGYLLLELFTCILVGPPGVGKTLLKYLLLSMKPPFARTSTPGAEQPIKIRSVSSSKIQKLLGRWKEVSEEQLLPMIGRYIRQNVKKLRMIIPDEIKEYLDLLEMSPTTTASEEATSSVATASSGDSSTTKVGVASPSLPSDGETQSTTTEASTCACTSCLDATPTLAKLAVLRAAGGQKIKIIERVAPMWQSLGDQLDFDGSGSKLALIKAEHPTNQACCRAMFQHWLNGNGVRPCSWRTLIELINDLDQEVLAQEIRTALLSSAR